VTNYDSNASKEVRTQAKMKKVHVVILCGGSGTRLWPLSKEERPKQFLALGGSEETLIQKAVKRLENISVKENRWLVLGAKHEKIAKEQVGKQVDNFLIEPEARNTGPAVILAALAIQKKDPDAIMVVVHSDHLIETEAQFEHTLNTAIQVADVQNKFVILGIRPTFPSTGFGYIELGPKLEAHGAQDAPLTFEVLSFREKPDYETARSFLEKGNYMWNAGMFIWGVQNFLTEAKKVLPEVTVKMSSPQFSMNDYRELPKVSIDVGFMERIKNIACVPAEFSWQDIGTWGSVLDAFMRDSSGNVTSGDVFLLDTSNSVVHSEGPTIAAIGCNNLVIVASKDAVLVMPEGKGQEVKHVTEWLAKRNTKEK
jgi:mannose-1-phosphate guanylyltransferase